MTEEYGIHGYRNNLNFPDIRMETYCNILVKKLNDKT
jgi:hypothetical protein